MARWMKVLAVALAAVVGLVPAFAQVSYAQAVPIPAGEELDDAELATVEGEGIPVGVLWPLVKLGLKIGGFVRWVKYAVATAGLMATTTMQRGCQRVVEAANTLTLKGATFAFEHKLATDLTIGATAGGLHGGLRSRAETTWGKLADAVEGAAIGLGVGLTSFGVQKLAEWRLTRP